MQTSAHIRNASRKAVILCLAAAFSPLVLRGQSSADGARRGKLRSQELQKEVDELHEALAQLTARINTLELQIREGRAADFASLRPGREKADGTMPAETPGEAPGASAWSRLQGPSGTGIHSEATLNVTVDGYYEYNFNRPVGRVNLLRAYDVSSNSFSLNQAAIILERAADPAAGRRFGARLDLQFGQATETLQGNAANEPRPQVFRNVFQAYGTYVVPIGSGLTVDFGKWASAMGYENNYTKDQFNYSRSYFFDFLPFYHMGIRTTYNVNDRLTLSYWLVNGTQQTEDFNGFKSQVFQAILKPAKTVQWSLIYHTGREQRDLEPAMNPGLPALPTAPGLSTTEIEPAPNGGLHILDTYVSWSPTPRLTLVGESDYVLNRVFEHSAPAHVTGGAAYARYQFTPRFALTARAEYLSDRGGLFSGVTQALKENTLTADYKLAEGFLARWEWRRDSSNQPFFLAGSPGERKKEQNTATLGLIWWWGQKQGTW